MHHLRYEIYKVAIIVKCKPKPCVIITSSSCSSIIISRIVDNQKGNQSYHYYLVLV